MKKRYFFYIISLLCAMAGCMEGDIPTTGPVTEIVIDEVTAHSVTYTVKLLESGCSKVESIGVKLDWDDYPHNGGTLYDGYRYTQTLSGLKSNTKYEIFSYGWNADCESRSESQYFKTLEEPRVTLASSSMTFSHEGAYKTVALDSNTDWSATSSQSWLTVTPSSGKGDTTVKVSVKTNTSTTSRSGKVTFTSSDGTATATLTVNQYSKLINGHEYVDLGLSVLWATMNVGATSPEDYGDYFAWGETKPKSNYSWSNCYDCLDADDYENDSSWGTYKVGGKTQIPEWSGQETARMNWGGTWRMPTYYELNELVNKCSWQWGTKNGVSGYTVTGSNGNSIFLPAAGNRGRTGSSYAGTYGMYWSSTLDSKYSYEGFFLRFDDAEYSAYWINWRYLGQSVRPVTD